jgi:hypothetical protein
MFQPFYVFKCTPGRCVYGYHTMTSDANYIIVDVTRAIKTKILMAPICQFLTDGRNIAHIRRYFGIPAEFGKVSHQFAQFYATMHGSYTVGWVQMYHDSDIIGVLSKFFL